MRLLILGWSVGLKKKNIKKIHKKSRRTWYPRVMLKVNIHIFGLTKCKIYCKKCSCFCSCFSLCCYILCSFFRLKYLFQMKNGLTASTRYFFFFEKAKNLGRSHNGGLSVMIKNINE